MTPLHRRRTHPEYVEGCKGCHFATLHINHSSEYARIETAEKQLTRDREAYAAMRKQGLQPPNLHGAAELQAKATNAIDVNHADNPFVNRLSTSEKTDLESTGLI